MLYNKNKFLYKYGELAQRAWKSPTFRLLFTLSSAVISDKPTSKGGAIYFPYPPTRAESLDDMVGVLAHELYHSLEIPQDPVEDEIQAYNYQCMVWS